MAVFYHINKDNLATITWDLEPNYRQKQEGMGIRELQDFRQEVIHSMKNCRENKDPRYDVYLQVLLKCHQAEDEIYGNLHKKEFENKWEKN